MRSPFPVGTYTPSATNTEVPLVAIVSASRSPSEDWNAFAQLEPRKMIRNGLSAPLHPGAERYYREKGWM